MPVRAFDEDAQAATATSLPVPRGIAFRYDRPEGPPASLTTPDGPLPGWEVKAVPGLPGWFETLPPALPTSATSGPETPSSTQPIPLGQFWDQLRALRKTKDVSKAEPLLLIVNPTPASPAEAEAFAMSLGPERFGFWGLPYDSEIERQIREAREAHDWHLTQMKVRQAWSRWQAKHPGRLPGDGILVGHPDTGYSDHRELTDRFRIPGKSFLRRNDGTEEDSALDDLQLVGSGFLQAPGHGTATASVIASAEQGEVRGVAPGARLLPLRVSRSVLHLDFSNVGRAILHAVDQGADVISMSLGGPGYSEFVRDCIRHAHQQGVIVVAAAGNAVPSTGFPAAFPEVIAVAATHAANAPWRFSGVGPLVDIAAPGEDVWCARAEVRADGAPADDFGMGTGTSFATACVAGLAALWLSYHGGREAVATAYGGRKELVPFAFQYLLSKTANKRAANAAEDYEFVREGKHGAGIADAAALLEPDDLPSQDKVLEFKQRIENQPVHALSVVTGLFSGLFGLTDPAAKEQAAEAQEQLLRGLLGPQTDELLDELRARVAADRLLLIGCQRWRPGEALLPLLDRLLAGPKAASAAAPPTPALSGALRQRLAEQRRVEAERLQRLHRGKLIPGVMPVPPSTATRDGSTPPGPRAPAFRQLRAYAFDPSLETELDTAPIHAVTIPTRWEHLEPGPIGEYLEVVDVDPSSGCAYSPVDLNHPHVLGQNGLPPSEGDPQFHQQMVYAVAMNTIHRFELALGRPIFWAPLRPWLRERPEEQQYATREALAQMERARTEPLPPGQAATRERYIRRQDRYVQRLRIYPHALREANAYYSPLKRALLFGYFPAADDDTGRHYPGGMVFTCLSHDIIAHETTHALLDGMHPYFNEPSNQDVWAFHEAFADVMALFQHFTYPELLRHQIANTRGDLETDNLLAQLAQQFGQATGGHGALRNALGGKNEKTGKWERRTPDPHALRAIGEPHDRGSILVAAVFDAFLALYNYNVADLLRIYTGGTGILPQGQIHPDLVNRLATEAAQAAEEVLRICIRAMDYVPPVDITFGEFLRALITADYELAPTRRRRTRVAFIDAFRSWGIYPRDVPSLSEDSLLWRGPDEDDAPPGLRDTDTGTLAELLRALEEWQPGSDRGRVFERVLLAQREFHQLLQDMQARADEQAGDRGRRPLLPGLDLRKGAGFSISNLRPARRIGLQGEFRTEMVVELVQTHRPAEASDRLVPFRGGATLIVDLRSRTVRYVIYKRLYEKLPERPGGDDARLTERCRRQQRFEESQRAVAAGGPRAAWQGEDTGNLAEWLAATYACEERQAARRKKQIQNEPFALLHRRVE